MAATAVAGARELAALLLLLPVALLLTAPCATVSAGRVAPQHDVVLAVNWSDYLARNDLVWNWTTANPPVKRYHSAFLGNGAMGLMIRRGAAAGRCCPLWR